MSARSSTLKKYRDEISDASSTDSDVASEDSSVESLPRRNINRPIIGTKKTSTVEVPEQKPIKQSKHKKCGTSMKLTSVNFLLGWKFKDISSDCGICKHNIVGPSPKLLHATSKSKVIDLSQESVVLGKCGHAFHKTCIDGCGGAGGCLCPTDSTDWEIDRYLETGDNPSKDQMAILTKSTGKKATKRR